MIEVEISKAIIERYTQRLLERLDNDVVIVGAGPAGLAAAYYLAKANFKTTVIEKKLSVGGGMWGGAAGYNVVTFEDTEILDELDIRTERTGSLYTADAIEFATGLAYSAKKAGAEIFNLIEVEDIVLIDETVRGVVVNGASIRGLQLHIDPFCICSRCVVDVTGHPAELVTMLKKRKPQHFPQQLFEYFLNVENSEAGVVEKTGKVFPGLYVAGMAVCDVYNLPRMGPIFGGMLKSGKKVAELIANELRAANA